MPKDKKERQRHDPLHVQLQNDSTVVYKQKQRKEKEIKESSVVDSKTSRKIFKLAKAQLEEFQSKPVDFNAQEELNEEEIIEIEDEDENEYDEWNGIEEFDPEEEKLIEQFAPTEKQKVLLADQIMAKISQKSEQPEMAEEGLNPKVIEVYEKVGLLLSRYKSGPLPKTFKIVPTLRDWEQVVYITNPEQWTPQAMFAATRIFTSNLKSKMAQRFFSLILLERVRNEIHETKKLNYHLYMAVKKSLYKPAAFFKGFLLPLCESGTCTLREAAIISSVLVKVSIPMLHSAAALLKLAEMDYTGPNSLFIRVLLDKKYALPFKVVDSLVFHFLAFKNDSREMPVLWHQSLLVFCQRYKEDITIEQKEALLDLLKHKAHASITPEIRRELLHAVSRGGTISMIE